MAWYNIFKKKAKLSSEKVSLDNLSLQHLINGYGITTNQEVRDRNYVEQGYQKNPTVQAIVNITQRNAASVPWKIYKKDKNGKRTEVTNRTLENLMLRPNTEMTWSDLVSELIGFYLLQGDMYLWGLKGKGINAEKYSVLRPLPSQHVQINLDPEGFGGVAGYSLDYSRNRSGKKVTQRGKTSVATEIAPEDILHIKNFNPEYDEDATFFYGQSPLRAARRSLDVNNRCIDTQIAFLENQGIRGLLYMKNGNVRVREEQIDKLQDNFNKKRGGVLNSNKVAVTNGEWDFLNLMNKTADLQLMEQYVSSVKDICLVYGFPCGLLGIGKDTYQNMPEYKRQLWNEIVIPLMSRLRDGLNAWLTPQFGDNVYIDFDLTNVNAIQEDLLMRGKAIKEFAGYITLNEAREKAGMPLADMIGDTPGDARFVGFTQSTVDDSEGSGENGTNQESSSDGDKDN